MNDRWLTVRFEDRDYRVRGYATDYRPATRETPEEPVELVVEEIEGVDDAEFERLIEDDAFLNAVGDALHDGLDEGAEP